MLKSLHEDSDINKDTNILFYCPDLLGPEKINTTIVNFVSENTSNILNHCEVFKNTYLHPKLTLSQNIEFHCNCSGKKSEDFIEKHQLEDYFKRKNNSLVVEISNQEKLEISMLLYMFNNSVNIFNRGPIMRLVKGKKSTYSIFFKQYFSSNAIYYFSKENEKFDGLENIFDFFVIMKEDNDFIIFNNTDDLKNHLQN